MFMTMTPAYDVAIVGGGLAGLATALALADAGARVAIIERQSKVTRLDTAFDGRTSAISYANFRMFDRLGVGSVMREGAEPIHRILITDGRPASRPGKDGPGAFWLSFLDQELTNRPDAEPLGWMLENRTMRAALIDALEAHDAVTIHDEVSVTRHEVGGAVARLTLSHGEELVASLLVAADGAHSPLADAAGIRRLQWSYGQTALVVTVHHERPHNGIAHEYFLPSGPFAILPMTGQRASIVWTEKDTLAAALGRLDDTAYLAELTRRFGDFLGTLSLAAPRFAYPLGLSLAEELVADRLALVGDAARRIHPIAGQGFNLGLKDAAALADCVRDGLHAGLDAGDGEILARYQRWRRFDSVTMALATDVFTRLFSNDIGPVRLVRGLGMSALRHAAPARNFFTRTAGAETGDLPSLLRA